MYLHVVDKYFAESSWKHVTSLLVATITDVGHKVLSLETPSYSVVDTLGLPPVTLK